MTDLYNFNSPAGIYKIWVKSPDLFQNQWRTFANDYKRVRGIDQPFLEFNYFNKKVQEYTHPIYVKKPRTEVSHPAKEYVLQDEL